MSTVATLPHLSSEANAPLYQQLKLWFVEEIQRGRWADAPLPSERALSETLNISRATVRQAIDSLEREGWVEKKHGKGTFVAPPKVAQSLSHLSGFSENMRRAGLEPTSQVIAQTLQEPSDALRRTLALPPDGRVAVVTRLRLADGKPLMLERSHLTYRLTPGLLEQDLTKSLYAVLTKTYRLVLARGEESLEVVQADEATARLLELKQGDPLLYTQRLVTNERGVPIEYAERYARSDKCKFTVSLSGERADFAVKDEVR